MMGFLVTFRDFCVTSIIVIFYTFRSCLTWILPKKKKTITDDIVLITGGGKGVGRLLAVEFAKQNPKHIILWGRHAETLSATAKAVMYSGVSCSFMVCDLSKKEQIEERARDVCKKVGDVTILVNNAGVVFGNSVLESKAEDMEHTMKVNTLAHYWTIRAFLPKMIEKNHGHLLTINSMVGYMGLAGAADYSASKFACTGLAETLRLELLSDGHTGVHITSIHPYIINTDMFAGCVTRFPWMFPPLDKEMVAQESVDALLTNTYQVLMPWTMYPFIFVKSILPVGCLQVIQKFLGADRAMDTFHARQGLKT